MILSSCAARPLLQPNCQHAPRAGACLRAFIAGVAHDRIVRMVRMVRSISFISCYSTDALVRCMCYTTCMDSVNCATAGHTETRAEVVDKGRCCHLWRRPRSQPTACGTLCAIYRTRPSSSNTTSDMHFGAISYPPCWNRGLAGGAVAPAPSLPAGSPMHAWAMQPRLPNQPSSALRWGADESCAAPAEMLALQSGRVPVMTPPLSLLHPRPAGCPDLAPATSRLPLGVQRSMRMPNATLCRIQPNRTKLMLIPFINQSQYVGGGHDTGPAI
jgi:hypothetical protein